MTFVRLSFRDYFQTFFFLFFFFASDVSFHARVKRVWNILRNGKNLETASLVRLKQREQNSNYPDRRRIFASKEVASLVRWRVLRKRIEEETKLKIICFFAPNTLVASDYFYLLVELIANYLSKIRGSYEEFE